ncbi:hypothetical protein [Aurantivibrio plasticivorans]
MKNSFLTFIFLLVLWPIVGCSENSVATTSDYNAEASALCEALSPAYWAEASKGKSPAEIQTLLTQRIEDAVSSNEMTALIQNLSSHPIEERYLHIQSTVKELTGEDYDCPALKDYFSF